MDSILTSIKKALGIEREYDHFDPEIIMAINTVLMTLNQVGVGPEDGYFITGDEESWKVYLEDSMKLEAVKTYVYLKVRLIFDPPANSYLLESIKNQINELEWRLNVKAEGGM